MSLNKKIFELSKNLGYLKDSYLRRQICEIVQSSSIDKDYAEFLMTHLVHGYVKKNHPELFERLK